MFTSVHIIIFSITSIVTASEIADGDREARLLNVFSIVKFPNSACNTTGGNYYGTCYTATECAALGINEDNIWANSDKICFLGGTNSGSCASGFGVCCSLTAYCGGTTSSNNTYFVSQSADTSPCTFNVCKASDDICQIR